MKQVDDLAARRALKAVIKIGIRGGDKVIERDCPIPAGLTPDPAATLRARAPRRRRPRSADADA